MTSHVSDDELLDLTLGLLGPVDRENRLAHLRVCASCEDRFRAMAGPPEGALATDLQDIRPGDAKSTTGPAPPRADRWMRIALLAAAAIVLAAGINWLMRP